MSKVWKLQHSLFLRYPTAFSQNTFLLRKWLSFVPRPPEIPPGTRAEMPWIWARKLCRWTYFGQWIPQESSIDVWNTATPNLADKPTSADEPPQGIKNTCLEYCYTKLGRWTYFGQWAPGTRAEMACIPLHKTWQMNLLWLMDPLYQSRDDLHTTT